MKRLTLWVVSALAGVIFILLLNASPLARLGFSIELPNGWQIARTKHICTDHESADPNSNNCAAVTCTLEARHNEGIPFSTNRVSKTSYCGTDWNNLATFLNAFVGAGIGVLYSLTMDKRWPKKQTK